MKIGCIIMAAGQGVRFGGNKLLAPLNGEPVLGHVLARLPRERLQKMIAVARSEEVAWLCMQQRVDCLIYGGGAQSDTVRLGIDEMSEMDGCLFVMGDQPLCTRQSLECMLAQFEKTPDCVLRLAFQGRAGSPVLFPRRFFSALAALQGEQGGMAALHGQQVEICLVEAGHEAELWDADTVQDLQKIERYFLQNAQHGIDGQSETGAF